MPAATVSGTRGQTAADADAHPRVAQSPNRQRGNTAPTLPPHAPAPHRTLHLTPTPSRPRSPKDFETNRGHSGLSPKLYGVEEPHAEAPIHLPDPARGEVMSAIWGLTAPVRVREVADAVNAGRARRWPTPRSSRCSSSSRPRASSPRSAVPGVPAATRVSRDQASRWSAIWPTASSAAASSRFSCNSSVRAPPQARGTPANSRHGSMRAAR